LTFDGDNFFTFGDLDRDLERDFFKEGGGDIRMVCLLFASFFAVLFERFGGDIVVIYLLHKLFCTSIILYFSKVNVNSLFFQIQFCQS
jgi:hypothetical protein